jgi:hypothetical protein
MLPLLLPLFSARPSRAAPIVNLLAQLFANGLEIVNHRLGLRGLPPIVNALLAQLCADGLEIVNDLGHAGNLPPEAVP